MAGITGNVAWLMFQKQSAKGTLATVEATKAHKVPYVGGSIGPVREFDQLSETDSTRDQGVSYVKAGGVSGSPECYVRDSSIGALLTYVLGADAVLGTLNYTHVITPANTIPYVSFWNNIGGVLYESYKDCYVSSLEIKASAGSPLTAVANIIGITPTRLTTDPSTSPAISLESGYVYNFNNAAIKLGGTTTALISSMDITIDNQVTTQQTDNFLPYDLAVGERQVSLSFDIIFENLNEYNKFHYGAEGGTAINQTIYTTEAEFEFTNGEHNGLKFLLPTIAYEEFPVSPDPSGAPITVSCRAVAQRPVGAANVITATIQNQTAAY